MQGPSYSSYSAALVCCSMILISSFAFAFGRNMPLPTHSNSDRYFSHNDTFDTFQITSDLALRLPIGYLVSSSAFSSSDWYIESTSTSLYGLPFPTFEVTAKDKYEPAELCRLCGGIFSESGGSCVNSNFADESMVSTAGSFLWCYVGEADTDEFGIQTGHIYMLGQRNSYHIIFQINPGIQFISPNLILSNSNYLKAQGD